MTRLSDSLLSIMGPNPIILSTMVDVIIDAVRVYGDLDQYGVDTALAEMHECIDFAIAQMYDISPEAQLIDYTIVYNGSHFEVLAHNEYTQYICEEIEKELSRNP